MTPRRVLCVDPGPFRPPPDAGYFSSSGDHISHPVGGGRVGWETRQEAAPITRGVRDTSL